MFKVPRTEEEWIRIREEFEEKWNFSNSVGALHGKHIQIKRLVNSGSYYFNYKDKLSIVLPALVDADYKFTYIDTGSNGRIRDGGVYRNATLSSALENNSLNIRKERKVDDFTKLPYVKVGDDAFPMKPFLIKPYPERNLSIEQRIFGYRQSKAGRVVENGFGIPANRFRVFLSPLSLAPENVEKIFLANCALHNFLRTKCPSRYTPSGSFDK